MKKLKISDRIIMEKETHVYVPYEYKNDFKRKFNGHVKWDSSEKCWIVFGIDREEVEKYVERKNKRIEKGNPAPRKRSKKIKKLLKDYTLEDYCQVNGLDPFDKKTLEKYEKFKNFYNKF